MGGSVDSSSSAILLSFMLVEYVANDLQCGHNFWKAMHYTEAHV